MDLVLVQATASLHKKQAGSCSKNGDFMEFHRIFHEDGMGCIVQTHLGLKLLIDISWYFSMDLFFAPLVGATSGAGLGGNNNEYELLAGAMCPSWKMMDFVNGKDDIPYVKWERKHVWNHQPEVLLDTSWSSWLTVGRKWGQLWPQKTLDDCPTSHPIVSRKNVHPISQVQTTIIDQSNIPICCMVNGYDVMYAWSMYASILFVHSNQEPTNIIQQCFSTISPFFLVGNPYMVGPPVLFVALFSPQKKQFDIYHQLNSEIGVINPATYPLVSKHSKWKSTNLYDFFHLSRYRFNLGFP